MNYKKGDLLLVNNEAPEYANKLGAFQALTEDGNGVILSQPSIDPEKRTLFTVAKEYIVKNKCIVISPNWITA